ncbi:MAG: hypothetical protein ACKVU1_13405 [bacterium]
MSSGRLSIEDLLHRFPANELGHALVAIGLPGDGSKQERVARLLAAGQSASAPATQLLALMRAESLRRVCGDFGLSLPTKADMVNALVTALRQDERTLSPDGPRRVEPTFPAVVEYLGRLELGWRRIRDEADAEAAIEAALRREFSRVSTQYSVGGYLGYRIDIDLGDGAIGVEVKLADSIVNASSETYRTIGQAVVYDRRKYKGKVIVAIAGPDDVFSRPAMAEIESLLRDVGVTPVRVRLR